MCEEATVGRKALTGEVVLKIPVGTGGHTLPLWGHFRVEIPEGWRYVSASHLCIEDAGYDFYEYKGHQLERNQEGKETVLFMFKIPTTAPVNDDIARSGMRYQILLERSCRPSMDAYETHSYYQDSAEDPIVTAIRYTA